MSTSAEYDFAGHDDRIRQHYAHAIKKHPYFCDYLGPYGRTMSGHGVTQTLEYLRECKKESIDRGDIGWYTLLDCEIWEVFEALSRNDKEQAVEHLYKAAVVCFRAIDVLEDRQTLGKPKEMLPPCTCGATAATIERGTEPEGFAIMCPCCFRHTALRPSLALAEDEWRTMFPNTNNKTTKENNK